MKKQTKNNKRAELLAVELIDTEMTKPQIADFLGIDEGDVGLVLREMRVNVLEGMDALCPRPTQVTGWLYSVLDTNPNTDHEVELQDRGSIAVASDLRSRVQRMVPETSVLASHANARTKKGKAAIRISVMVQALLVSIESAEELLKEEVITPI